MTVVPGWIVRTLVLPNANLTYTPPPDACVANETLYTMIKIIFNNSRRLRRFRETEFDLQYYYFWILCCNGNKMFTYLSAKKELIGKVVKLGYVAA